VTDETLCVAMSHDTGNAVTAQACNFDGSGLEKWFYDQGTKTIKNVESGKCLDVNEEDPMKSIGVWPCHGRNNQKWILDDSNRLTSLGKCMKWNWNGKLRLKKCSSYRQIYSLVQTPQVALQEEYKPIHYSYPENTCVDMARVKSNGKYNVSIKPCNEAKNQNWFINTQQRTIKNERNGYCLDVDIRNKNNLIAWECHGRSNQQWAFDNFNRIRSVFNRNCLSKNWNTSNLSLYGCNGGDNQEFWY